MALFGEQFGHQPLPGERKARAADVAEEWRVAREGIEVIAHGALICPECSVPLAVSDRVPAGRHMTCGYCGHTDRARMFLKPDVFDTVGNEAYMVAWIPG